MAKKQEEEVKQGLPAWMGTYGDMVTLLLCFFVLLFSMSSVDVRKFQEAISSFKSQIDVLPGGEALTDGERINNGTSQLANIEILVEKALPEGYDKEEEDGKKESGLTEEDLEELAKQKAQEVYQEVNQYLEEEGVLEDVDVKYSLNYVKITLPGEALFDSGEARIKGNAFKMIDVLGEMIKTDDFVDYSIQIEGHTDNIPINTAYFPSNWELSASRAISVGKYLIDTLDISEDKIACTGYGEYKPMVSNDTIEGRAMNRRVELKIILQSEEVDVEEYSEISQRSDSPTASNTK